MGNNAAKEARNATTSDPRTDRSGQQLSHPHDDSQEDHAPPSRSSRSRHDGPFLGIGSHPNEQRKETKQERDNRRAEKERATRLKERERSLKEQESVDGGYLVTLGTYTGPEDFNKLVVRQLMLERRIAPFWRGLNDHSDSWTEHQLVAAGRGLPIPAPDEIPPELSSSPAAKVSSSSSKPIPIHSRPGFSQTSTSSSLHGPSNTQAQSPSSPLFRGRSKTLASLNLKNNDSQSDLIPQEINLPHEPLLKGQPIEAHLYKDAMECPICFLYYPPYLNRTRCCDQPICSECFVQIKRPDPHPPEHLDPNSPVPEDVHRLEEEGQLVSEPAACPFCVQAEFGVSYEPPPFRRGLAYNNNAFSKSPTAMSSSPSPYGNGGPSGATRRRGQSLSATAPSVITTDKVRPDWAKKLSDARAHAARRSAAASALHHQAYMTGGDQSGRLGFRRRRYFIAETPGSDGSGGEAAIAVHNMEMLMAALAGEPGTSRGRRAVANATEQRRFSSSSRTDEIEDLMLREAIRLSLAADEERKRKEDKEAVKKAKKDEKTKAKEQKKADKAAKKNGSFYTSSANASAFFTGGASSSVPVEEGKGKGKAFLSDTESGAILNEDASSSRAAQKGKEIFEKDSTTCSVPLFSSARPRQLSDASSSGSSFGGPSSNSSRYNLPAAENSTATGGPDSSFNFGSLAAMIDNEAPAEPLGDVGRARGRSDSPLHVGSESSDQDRNQKAIRHGQ